MASIKRRPNGKWRARYRDHAGREHARHFETKARAQTWLDAEIAKLVTGEWVEPKARKITVSEWCDRWLEAYGTRRASTVRQARVNLAKIKEEFGPRPLGAVLPVEIKAWLSRLRAEGYSASYVYALHNRLSQVMADAVRNRLLPVNPCSRETSPGAGSQRPYVAATEQVWALYEALPERYRVAVLLGAFAGLRIAEACGLRVADVVFLRREIRPAVQYPAAELKTETSRTPIPVADTLLAALAEQIRRWPAEWVLTGPDGGQLEPWRLERAMRSARKRVPGLPEGFRFQDLRHYFASLLIASGADVKVVQARLRHASAKTTLDVYGHLWPDTDESSRSAVERVMSQRMNAQSPQPDQAADSVRTIGGGA